MGLWPFRRKPETATEDAVAPPEEVVAPSVDRRLGWWLWQSLFIGGGLFLLINLIPSLGILILILPLFPVVFAILAIANAAIDKPWAYAIGGSLFFGWMLLAYFPLTG